MAISRPTPSTAGKALYRPEIDGLRALAVIAVIVNHFNNSVLPQGYLGVDIFFVISGYVITSSLLTHQTESFAELIVGFYARRIKRLLPALACFTIITSILACLFIPDPGQTLGYARRALLGITNISLYSSSTNYFSDSTELLPFTHTWSLGVEEQFYMIFPFLIWFSNFGNTSSAQEDHRRLLWIALIFSVTSLTSFAYLYELNQPAAYFLMPARAWELGAGILAFLAQSSSNRAIHRFMNIKPIIPIMALALILFSQPNSAVLATMGAVAATVSLILSLRKGSMAHRVLSHKHVVFIGLMSYSLYLWHWGILCLARWTIGLHWWSIPILALLIFFSALASYVFIEKPARQADWLQSNWRAIGGGMGVSTASCLFLMFPKFTGVDLYTGRHTKSNPDNMFAQISGTKVTADNCSWHEGAGPNLTDALKNCILPGEGKRHFYILGDSHAGGLTGLMAKLNEELNIQIRLLYVNGTTVPPAPHADEISAAPLDQLSGPTAKHREDDAIQYKIISATTKDLKPGDVVILANYLLSKFKDTPEASHEPKTSQKNLQKWGQRLDIFLEKMHRLNVDVIVFSILPEFGSAKKTVLCDKEWFRPTVNPLNCNLTASRSQLLNQSSSISRELSRLRTRHENLHIYDPFPHICPEYEINCKTEINGRRYYYDNSNHFNVWGSELLYPSFTRFLREHGLLDSTNST